MHRLAVWMLALIGITLLQVGAYMLRGYVVNEIYHCLPV